jgi:hypothetical protein
MPEAFFNTNKGFFMLPAPGKRSSFLKVAILATVAVGCMAAMPVWASCESEISDNGVDMAAAIVNETNMWVYRGNQLHGDVPPPAASDMQDMSEPTRSVPTDDFNGTKPKVDATVACDTCGQEAQDDLPNSEINRQKLIQMGGKYAPADNTGAKGYNDGKTTTGSKGSSDDQCQLQQLQE